MLLDFCSFSNSFIAFEPPATNLDPVLPQACFNLEISTSSFFSESANASFLALSTSTWAAVNADAMSFSIKGSLKMFSRFSLAEASVAKYLARPIWPPDALATKSATFGSTPSLVTSKFEIAFVDGVLKDKCRQRDLIVGNTSVKVGAHKSQTVLSPGSSITFKSALAAESVNRSASSITTTRQFDTDGAQDALLINSLISSIFIDKPSVLINSTSACEPVIVDMQSLHLLQPPSLQTRAAANATAALDLPDPGGPVNNQA
ncbi:unannotated protein [freshwater metagenome]|uniref:Unannotated protein n=1 Tax=freshwater metagenome TaxID=449393 RepID=A0A6J7R5I4_9ZZZZ